MSEMIWCAIEIKVPESWSKVGGKIERTRWTEEMDVPPVVAWLFDTMGGEIDDGEEAGGYRWSVTGDLNYGWGQEDAQQALEWLRQHRIPFIARCDPKYEWEGEWTVFDGTTEIDRAATAEDISLTARQFEEMVQSSSCELDTFAKVREYFQVPTFADLPIDHLTSADWPPLDDEDEEERCQCGERTFPGGTCTSRSCLLYKNTD